MAVSFCGQCGQPVSDSVKFCTSCGAPIVEKTKTEPTATESTAETNTAVVAAAKPNPKTKTFAMAAISIAVIAAIVIAVVMLAQPKQYSGYPSSVVKEIGVVEPISSSNNIVAELTVSTSILTISKGDTSVLLRDPIDGHLYGTALLSTPATKSYSGILVVKGKVFICNGVDSINLTDAKIVKGS